MITNKAEFIDPLVDFKHKKDLKKKREREHRHVSKSMFGSVVAGAFQITFRAKMHVNDVFSFLKIIFDISTSKRSKIYKSY